MRLALRRTTLGPLALGTVLASGAFLLAGVLLPQAADALLRLYLATLAAVYIFSRGYEALSDIGPGDRVYSPFQDPDAGSEAPTAPRPVRNLAVQLQAADHPDRAAEAAIPTGIRATVRTEANRRLQERHGLDPRVPAHGREIRTLVSGSTWRVIGPLEASNESGSGGGPHRGTGNSPVPLTRLSQILDDVEAL